MESLTVVGREIATPGFGNLTTIRKSIGNKNSIQLTFISSCCLGFRTEFGPFWTNSSCYLQDGRLRALHMDPYLVLSLTKFSQHMNDGFLCPHCIFYSIDIYCKWWHLSATNQAMPLDWILYTANKWVLPFTIEHKALMFTGGSGEGSGLLCNWCYSMLILANCTH